MTKLELAERIIKTKWCFPLKIDCKCCPLKKECNVYYNVIEQNEVRFHHKVRQMYSMKVAQLYIKQKKIKEILK